jgi:hypothetical protein
LIDKQNIAGSSISGCLPGGAKNQIAPKACKINGLRAFSFPFIATAYKGSNSTGF